MSEVTFRYAAAAIAAGEVVTVPTDTVYGLAVAPHHAKAVELIFELKGRPRDKALPVLGDSLKSFTHVAKFDDRARSLAERFWPGPLTLVLRRAEGFDHDLGGPGDGTIAVRVPDNALTRALLAETGALAVTSANRSGEPPARSAEDAERIFPGVPVLDGGPSDGLPSTVLSLLGAPEVLREGSIDLDQIQAAITS